MRTWYPDFCPSGSCAIELTVNPDGSTDWSTPKSIVRLCAHHQSVKDSNVLDNAGIFRAILQSSRVKEAARWAAKVELGLDKEHPGVRYRVNTDGSFALLTSIADLAWVRIDGTSGPVPTISGATRNRMRNAVTSSIDLVDKPVGTSALTVE